MKGEEGLMEASLVQITVDGGAGSLPGWLAGWLSARGTPGCGGLTSKSLRPDR